MPARWRHISLPTELALLEQLQLLDLSTNTLTSTLPNTISDSNLEEFHIAHNALIGK